MLSGTENVAATGALVEVDFAISPSLVADHYSERTSF